MPLDFLDIVCPPFPLSFRLSWLLVPNTNVGASASKLELTVHFTYRNHCSLRLCIHYGKCQLVNRIRNRHNVASQYEHCMQL